MITIAKTWHPVRVEDLHRTGQQGTCERCGRNDLRFLHHLESQDGERLAVGSECARKLCQGYSPAEEERKLRNLWNRRTRWVSRDWQVSWKGNETLRFIGPDGKTARVTIFPGRFGGFSWCLVRAGDTSFSQRYYGTAAEAKLAAFDRLAEEAS